MVVSWAYNAGTNTATASGAGSTDFAALVAADTAGGWGVYTADATGTQIICGGKIFIGDGTAGSTTLLADSSKEIIFTAAAVSADYTYLLYVREYASLKLGNVVDATTKSTNNGVTIISLQNNYNSISMLMSRTTAGTTELYGCTFEGLYRRHFIRGYVGGETITAFNCITDYVCFQALTTDFFNINAVGRANTFPMLELLGGTLNILRVSNAVYGYWQTSTATADSTISGYYARNITKFGYFAGSKNVYFVNPDSSSWVFTYSTFTGKVYRQYEFDLQTAAGATVTLTDKDDNVVFSVTADAVTGKIATQTVSRGYYAQATGDTLQDYSPHTLTITGTGYIPYVRTFTLEEKTKWLIELHDQLAGNADEADVASGKLFYKDDADTILVGSKVEAPAGGATTYVTVTEAPEDYEPLKELVVCLLDQKNLIRKTAGIPLE